MFGWQVIDILILYWTESVIIGVINVQRMSKCRGNNLLTGLVPGNYDKKIPPEMQAELQARMSPVSLLVFKLFVIPFFVLHYGAFCYGHLMAVIGLFGASGPHDGLGNSLRYFWRAEFWIVVTAISVSHLYSYFTNFIGAKEFQNASLLLLMQRPYGRIVAMHLTIVIGAGFVMWLGTPLPMLIVLILAKTWLDLRLHEKERLKLGAQSSGPGPMPVAW